MSDFVRAAKLAELSDPGKILVEVDDQLIVLFRVDGKFYALDDVCTHDGGPLSEGALDAAACTIACPRHGAKFDIKTGGALTMPATQATGQHEVKVVGDEVFVKLSDQ
ncbi:MAG TPA: non-heme iron oxygenase ferredoxin subunit [Pirellulales bacterium]